jgi:hypothetical protein
MTNGHPAWAGLVLVSSIGSSCRRDVDDSLLSQPVERAELRAPTTPGLPSLAAQAIAQARCTRELLCNNIGEGRAYASEPECARSIRAELADELNRVACSRGIDEAALDVCLRAIRQTRCSDTIDTVERWTACITADMCDKPPAPPPVPIAEGRPGR